MDKILILLDLIKQASTAEDKNAFIFTALNKTNDLIPYKQAIFWQNTDFGIKISDVSGNMTVDKNGPYAQYLKTYIKSNIQDKDRNKVQLFSHDTIHASQQSDWTEHIGAHSASVTLQTDEEGLMAGLWLEREKPFNEAEQNILEELATAYAQSYALLTMRERASLLSPLKRIKKHQRILFLLFVITCLTPVRLTVTAPTEIVARSPIVITVPFDGVIDEITVNPGDNVKIGQTLFVMDRTDLEGKIKTTDQALKSAQRNLSRLRREVLRAPEKKSEITSLNSQIAERKIEYEHAEKLLERSNAKSPTDGLAIFSDSNEFEGQPVSTGTKIMTIADPRKSELLIRVPIDTMLPINEKSPVEFFLNVTPLKGHKAKIISMGYQPSADADGILSYKIRAQITEKNNASPIRIGWKGTAKIKGEWTILAYSILRRPLIAIRNLTGV